MAKQSKIIEGTQSKVGPSGADFTTDTISNPQKRSDAMKEWSKSRSTETTLTKKDKPKA